jgi:hypothetical protein
VTGLRPVHARVGQPPSAVQAERSSAVAVRPTWFLVVYNRCFQSLTFH